jgi:hypothetical protein
MPSLHPLAVLCDHTFQKLELCLGAPPRRAPQKQVALPDDVLVRTSVVSGHGRFAPEEHPYCPSETSSCSWRHVSCRYHYDCAQKTRSSRGNLDAMRCSQRTLYEVRPRKDHRGVDLISASHLPNLSAQFLPCSLLIGFPSQRQEIDCKMQSNSR